MATRRRYATLLRWFERSERGTREEFDAMLEELTQFFELRGRHDDKLAMAWARWRITAIETKNVAASHANRRITALNFIVGRS